MRTLRPEFNAGYRILALLLLSAGAFALPSAAEAKPPATPGFKRCDALKKALEKRLAELRAKEEFDAKPRAEQLVILLERGVKKLGAKEFTGADVIEEVFAWKAMRAVELDKPALRTSELLPKALKACFGNIGARSRTEIRARYKASKVLVGALTDKHSRIRQLAIDCLFAIYGETRGYRADFSDAERKRAQKKWAKAIRR